MTSVCIIGVGAPHGDDWLGWELAERLRESEALAVWRDRLIISLHDRPGAALLQAWRGTGLVILIDSVRSGAAPGVVHSFDSAQLLANPHQLNARGAGVVEAVQLAAALEALPETLHFFGVEADPANTALHMSDPVYAALSGLVAEIEQRVHAFLTGGEQA